MALCAPLLFRVAHTPKIKTSSPYASHFYNGAAPTPL